MDAGRGGGAERGLGSGEGGVGCQVCGGGGVSGGGGNAEGLVSGGRVNFHKILLFKQ